MAFMENKTEIKKKLTLITLFELVAEALQSPCVPHHQLTILTTY